MSLSKFVKSRARIALIDADSVLYATALRAERKDDEGNYMQVLSMKECLLDIRQRLEKLVDDVDADDAIVCLSIGRSFRYDISATYKANRAGFRKPPLLGELKDSLIKSRKPFGVLAIAGLEADDICGISSTALQRANLREPVIVSIDKDLLTVPGLVYSWMREDDGIVAVSPEEADRAHLIQTLMGDVVDGYKGCPGIGKCKAAKLVNTAYSGASGLPTGTGLVAAWACVAEAFAERGLGQNEALTQARLAYIIRDIDWNVTSREITLWQPPGSALGSPAKVRLRDLPEGVTLH